MTLSDHHGVHLNDRVRHRTMEGTFRVWKFVTPGQFNEKFEAPVSSDPRDNCLLSSVGGTTVRWAWTGDLRHATA